MFLSYTTSGLGFIHCHPVLGLDGTHLKAKYTGVLLGATSVDANNRLFPLAYAVVDAENDKNWGWFVKLLRTVVQNHSPVHLVLGQLTFLPTIKTRNGVYFPNLVGIATLYFPPRKKVPDRKS